MPLFLFVFSGLTVIATLFPTYIAAAEESINVTFEKTPLFNEAAFMPGDAVTRWVNVENISDTAQRIYVSAESNQPDPLMSSALLFTIKEAKTMFYRPLAK